MFKMGLRKPLKFFVFLVLFCLFSFIFFNRMGRMQMKSINTSTSIQRSKTSPFPLITVCPSKHNLNGNIMYPWVMDVQDVPEKVEKSKIIRGVTFVVDGFVQKNHNFIKKI